MGPRIHHLARDGHVLALRVRPVGGADRAVLILPALGVPARKYDALAEAFVGEGMAAGTLDLRGQGDSTPRPSRGDDYGYADLASDVAPAMAELRRVTGTDRIVLLGHSLGGQLALIHVALNDPADIVLVGVGLPYGPDYRGRFRWMIWPFTQAVGGIATVMGVSPNWNFGGSHSKGVMRDWAYTARHGRWPTVDGVDPLQRLGMSWSRILGVHVENDDFTPPATTERLLRAAASARTSRYEYSEEAAGTRLDHFEWAKAPAPLVRRIAEFTRAR